LNSEDNKNDKKKSCDEAFGSLKPLTAAQVLTLLVTAMPGDGHAACGPCACACGPCY